MEDMQIVYLSPKDLKPYENNTRKHNPDDIDGIKKSILAVGFRDPIGIWGKDNLIVEGHGRQIAAIELGIERVPCIRLDDMTDEQRKEYAIRHNRTAELSSWDFGKLGEELADLELQGVDMSDLNFDIDDFSLDETKPIDITEDEAPEPPQEPKAKRGDIYQLGHHRLMCGDSTDGNDIAKLMNGKTARILFTSPPYSDMRDYEGGKDLSVNNLSDFIVAYRPYTDYQCVNLGIQRKSHEIFQYWDEYIKKAKDAGYKLMAWNVWDKMSTGSIGQAKAFFPIRHEFIFVFGTEFYEINLTVQKKEENIIENRGMITKRNKDGTTSYHTTGDCSKAFKQMESVIQLLPVLQNDLRSLHPAQFPVGLPSAYIQSMTNENEGVIEPFCGSGTTLIACEQTNRVCYGMELEPKYVDVIIERWENLTGEKAVKVNEIS